MGRSRIWYSPGRGPQVGAWPARGPQAAHASSGSRSYQSHPLDRKTLLVSIGDDLKRSLGPLEKLAALKLLWWAEREVPKMAFLNGAKTYLGAALVASAGLPDLIQGILAMLNGDFSHGTSSATTGLAIMGGALTAVGIGHKLVKTTEAVQGKPAE